ncbi:cytochrome c-type biogenesis protein CcmH [Salmonella enterica subsp. houtenae]|nr:cytochrome c-type biogenesis protein CcmH [Salmonella enterica subsp. houtenae]
MLLVSGSALATIDVMPFKDEAQEQQFRRLTEQLRWSEMPEQQHCGLERDDSHRHAPEGV